MVMTQAETLQAELNRLLDSMDVPVRRKSDVMWLNRNLAIRNSSHANFKRANEIILQLLREETMAERIARRLKEVDEALPSPDLPHNERFAQQHFDQWRGCVACKKSHHETSFCRKCGRCFYKQKIVQDDYGTFVYCVCGQNDLWD
jgi:hypothetical protein